MKMEAAAIAYVRYVLNVTQMTPSGLAKKSKISSTTLTRALNDPKHKFTLSTTTLTKIAEATGIPVAPFFEAEDQVNLTTAAQHPPETFEISSPRLINRQTPFSSMIVVIGDICPGYWQDPSLAATENIPLFLSLVGTKPRDTFACRVRDKGGLPIAASGEYVVCRRLFEHENPSDLSGRTVVAQAKSPKDQFRIEMTLRLLQPRNDGFDLITLDPADWKKRLVTTRMKRLDDHREVSILGVVEYVVREPRPFFPIMGALSAPDKATD